jgi:hypothetical protein
VIFDFMRPPLTLVRFYAALSTRDARPGMAETLNPNSPNVADLAEFSAKPCKCRCLLQS